METTKRCGKCGRTLPLSEFYKSYTRGTYQSWCKECFIERNKSAEYKQRAKERRIMKELKKAEIIADEVIKNAQNADVSEGRDIEKGVIVMPLREPLMLRQTDHGVIAKECTNKGHALFNKEE